MLKPAAPPKAAELQRILDAVPLLVASCDRDGRYTHLNAAYAARFGKTPDELIGSKMSEIVGPQIFAELRPLIERVLAGERVESEMTLTYPDVGVQTVRSVLTPIRDAAGAVIGWDGIGENVTVRRRAESRLRDFAFLVQNTSDFVGMADLEFRPFFLNDAARDLSGVEEEVFAESVFDFIAPEHHAFLRDELFPHVLRDGRASAEIQFRTPTTGEPFWMHYTVLRMQDAQGRPAGYATIGRSLVEHKRAEALLREVAREKADALARFQTLADSMPQIVWSANASGVTDYFNRQWYIRTRTTRPDEGEPLQFIHPDDREASVARWREALDARVPFETEFRLRFPGEEQYRWYLGRVVPVRDAAGAVVRWYGTSTDIDDQKRVETALLEADRQKDEFLGMLAHELRNPLAPLVYAVSVLERRLHDPAARRPLEIMRRQVMRISRLVDDLLDISRVTQGKIMLQRQRLDLAHVLRDALEVFRPVALQRRHEVEVELAEDVVVSGDAQRLGQVFENLLGNALKYTPDGGQISVRLTRDPDHAIVTIRDTGVGIEPEMLPRVFELFAQAETSLDRSQGGLGIGLTLVDRLTRLHGGSVSVSSAGLTHGSEFVVRLPLLGHLAEPPSPPPEQRSTHVTGARRILIVEDNPDIGETLADLLEMNGHIVRVINDGRTAVAAAEAFLPNVMLLDIGLPGLSGYEIVRAIRRTASLAQIPVVAVTGYGRQQDAEVSQAAGFTHHLTKPVSIEDLERIIASCAPRA